MKTCSLQRLQLATLLLFATACAGTGQPELTCEAYARASPPGELQVGEWTVQLDEAAVAFGPVYFCASASGAATLCEVALAELLEIERLDALDPGPRRLGRVRGFEGEIRSASFDYGIHWFMTESSWVRPPEAPGGHSARLRGRATRGDEVIAFTADLDVLSQRRGERAVPSVESPAELGGAPLRLDVELDVGAWLARVDFGALAAAGPGPFAIGPEPEGDDALVLSRRYQELVDAMVQRPPRFVWSELP